MCQKVQRPQKNQVWSQHTIPGDKHCQVRMTATFGNAVLMGHALLLLGVLGERKEVKIEMAFDKILQYTHTFMKIYPLCQT